MIPIFPQQERFDKPPKCLENAKSSHVLYLNLTVKKIFWIDLISLRNGLFQSLLLEYKSGREIQIPAFKSSKTVKYKNFEYKEYHNLPLKSHHV